MIDWIIIFLSSSLANGIKLIDIQMEPFAYLGARAPLNCRYEINGDTLYSVKWYKDDLEFYRFTPMDDPPVQTFPTDHFTIDLSRSNQSQVSIVPTNISASGSYKCEVSAEAPSFQTVSGEEKLTVIVLPTNDPAIEGGRSMYREGDQVNLQCKSGPSHPPARLTWYVNGLKVNSSQLRGPSIFAVSDGLQVTCLGLEFQAKRHHFVNSQLKLTCLASIDSVYLKSNEETIESSETTLSNSDSDVKDKYVEPPRNGEMYRNSAERSLANYFFIFALLTILRVKPSV